MPSPGPSYVREETLRLRAASGQGPEIRLGMTAPERHGGRLVADPPVGGGRRRRGRLARRWRRSPARHPGRRWPTIGPSLAGALAGFLDQEDGRQLIRLRMPPAADEARPWERPLVLMTAVRWDPVRAATLRPNELARELLRAFARSVEAAGSPA